MPDALAHALRAGERAGVILFRRNLPSVEAAAALCQSVIEAAGPELPPLISVDQEGGRVRRLPSPPFVLSPPMAELGRINDQSLTRDVARVVGEQLYALGFNLNFSPVVDVNSNPRNPVIGDRSFSDSPELVAFHGEATLQGLKDSGVAGCLKHFPGHGDTELDSHFALPAVFKSREELEQLELVPFRALTLAAPAMMSAHVVFHALDPSAPASLSRAICTTLLREQIGFDGVLFSDDMEMRAVADHFPIEESAVRAIEAGCDQLLLCHDADVQVRAHGALVRRAERDAAFRARCEQALQRAHHLRRGFPPPPETRAAEEVFAATAPIEQMLAARSALGV